MGLRVQGQRYTNTLGEMETEVLLRQLVGPAAAAAAKGWDGDRFALIDADGGPALVWFSVWDDAAARDRFASTLRSALAKLPRPATLDTREVSGRPGVLLRVGTKTNPNVTLTGGRP